MRYVTKKWLFDSVKGFLIENVGHTLTKNYNGTYWPLKKLHLAARLQQQSHCFNRGQGVESNYLKVPLVLLAIAIALKGINTLRG